MRMLICVKSDDALRCAVLLPIFSSAIFAWHHPYALLTRYVCLRPALMSSAPRHVNACRFIIRVKCGVRVVQGMCVQS